MGYCLLKVETNRLESNTKKIYIGLKGETSYYELKVEMGMLRSKAKTS